MNKYGNANVWRNCCRVFDVLAIAAVIDEVAGSSLPEAAGWTEK